jgi:hypothetical protein
LCFCLFVCVLAWLFVFLRACLVRACLFSSCPRRCMRTQSPLSWGQSTCKWRTRRGV